MFCLLVFCVQGVGSGIRGSWLRVWGLGSGIRGLEFAMKGLELRAQDLGCKVQGLWFGIWGGCTRPITLNPGRSRAEDFGILCSGVGV